MRIFYTTQDAKENPNFVGWVDISTFGYAVRDCYNCDETELNEAFHDVDTWLCKSCGLLVQRGLDLGGKNETR